MMKTAPEVTAYDGRPILSQEGGNDWLRERVASGRPFAAGKIGDTELEVLLRYEELRADPAAFFSAVAERGHEAEFLYLNSGVFPKQQDVLVDWAETFLASLPAIDLVGVWFNHGEEPILRAHAPLATLTRIRGLEPYFHDDPWTRMLAGKRVAVVSPFHASIRAQHERFRGADLFPTRPAVLPEFELVTVPAPFSPALFPPSHPSWHAALTEMQSALAREAFDVCLVGAGAYSLPLCAFVRTGLGRGAVHLGGATQILFGVRGRRWDKHPEIGPLINEHWTRPLPQETPAARWRNDGGAYW